MKRTNSNIMSQTEELRWRGKMAKETKLGDHAVKKPNLKFKVEWDLLFWMFLSFAVLYFTDFASHLLLNPAVRRWWLGACVLLFLVSIGCLVYSKRSQPTLNSSNWLEKAPVLVPVATIATITGTISLCVAVWPVWRFYTVFIISTLAMGFLSTVSLFNL